MMITRERTINCCWKFSKACNEAPSSFPEDWEDICLPHTWNHIDGQDGNNDYYRGDGWYVKELLRPEGEKIYLEIGAASSVASVYVNGKKAAYHEGGYSIFRTDITELLNPGKNIIAICVNNENKSNVYPQQADFTFYGGIYRDVKLICVPESHFDLDYYGGKGFTISSRITEKGAFLNCDAYITAPGEDQTVEIQVMDAEGFVVAETSCQAADHSHTKLFILEPHLWQGVKDPYLYQVKAALVYRNQVVDEVSFSFGIREYFVDPQKGFFLNGVSMPLRGVSRHQDRLGIGNALTREQHFEDAALIKEVGANTIRLAHYQHSQDFYDACDQYGFIVWAEIPFISVMNIDPKAHENCRSQMKELIIQNYNHPSICFWGISNEITIGGERPGLLENLKDLNALVKELDSTRLSTIAHVSMVSKESDMNYITDVVSYNHYFGWYSGNMNMNEEWLDDFHKMNPQISVGLSEYGAEGIITYHSDEPKIKDYSEDYQALYHEHMAKIIDERPWLWATHVWNMFDFGCDARDEGGVRGRNNKGLMTLDRKIKKDSFYAYKAYWSDEAFVKIAGRRYSCRTGETTKIKVYTNQPSVTLYVNGEEFGTIDGEKYCIFENVPLKDEFTAISAKVGCNMDSMTVQKAEELPASYTLPYTEDEEEGVSNWFHLEDYQDITKIDVREGYYSVEDPVSELLGNEEVSEKIRQAINTVASMKLNKGMMSMMANMSEASGGKLEMVLSMLAPENKDVILIAINEVLNKIKK